MLYSFLLIFLYYCKEYDSNDVCDLEDTGWNSDNFLCFLGVTASRGTSGNAALLCRTNLRGQCFVTGGEGTLRVWKVTADTKQAEAVDVKFGLIKRHIISMVVMYHTEEFSVTNSWKCVL